MMSHLFHIRTQCHQTTINLTLIDSKMSDSRVFDIMVVEGGNNGQEISFSIFGQPPSQMRHRMAYWQKFQSLTIKLKIQP